MKAVFILVSFLAFCLNVLAWDQAYDSKPMGYKDKAGTVKVVTGLPAIRDQDGAGYCYAFSATVLLEQFLCARHKQGCLPQKVDERLSVLDVASSSTMQRNSLKEGGSVSTLLYNIKKTVKENGLARESCAPYDPVVKMNRYRQNLGANDKEENEDINRFHKLHRANPVEKTANCLALFLKKTYPLGVSVEEIKKAFMETAFSENLRFKLFVPDQCRGVTGIPIPPFELHTYPSGKEWGEMSVMTLMEKAYDLISNNIPVNVNFCAREYENENGEQKCGLHAAVIVGTKEVCSFGTCMTMFKLQNSYGKGWQENNDDGWVRGDRLMEMVMHEKAGEQKLDWIAPPGLKIRSDRYIEEDEGERYIPPKINTGPKKTGFWICDGVITNIKSSAKCREY